MLVVEAGGGGVFGGAELGGVDDELAGGVVVVLEPDELGAGCSPWSSPSSRADGTTGAPSS